MAKETKSDFPNKWVLIAVPIAIVVILLLWFVGTYNALIAADQNVKNAWGNVETQYQRRIDLIPNLVSSVQGYMQYERGLLQNITELRSQWMSATTPEQQVAVSNQIESALKTIIAVREAYPTIKADTTVTALMDELAGTENRIQVARMNYNDAVRNYNNLVNFIPSNVIAGYMGYVEKPMFEAIAGADVVPVVNLTG